MDWKKTGQWALGVGGALFLGVVTNGLWDRLGQHVWDGLWQIMLSMFRETIYRQAAHGLYEGPSLILVLLIPSSLLLAALLPWILTGKRQRERPPSKGVLLFAVAVTTLLFIQAFQTTASHKLIQGFNQRLAIAAPVLTEEEEERLGARFASMTKRADYEGLRADLIKLAAERGVTLPE